VIVNSNIVALIADQIVFQKILRKNLTIVNMNHIKEYGMINYINEETVEKLKKLADKKDSDTVIVSCGPGDCNPVNNCNPWD